MQQLERNITFATADLAAVAKHKPSLCKQLLEKVFELVRSGKVQMIAPVTARSISEIHETFKMMQTGKHMGKFIMRIDEASTVQVQPVQPPTPKLKSEASYLVVGGTGGLGRTIIHHLAHLGAKHIMTLSRTGTANNEMAEMVEEMKHRDVELIVCTGSVSNAEDLEILKAQTKNRPIRGIVQGAMVLQVRFYISENSLRYVMLITAGFIIP